MGFLNLQEKREIKKSLFAGDDLQTGFFPKLNLPDTLIHLEFDPVQEAVDGILRFVTGIAILLLELADKTVVVTINLVKLVIGHGAPPFLDMATKLFPVAFQDICVHHGLLSSK